MANFRSLPQATLLGTLAAALLVAAPGVRAQRISDPANLAGERVSAQAPADTLPIDHGAPALQQLLLKLRTRASLMMIVAHPDDEDGGMLTYESRGQGARVAMLTLTRGEGGQNLMSADFNDALGLIRTQELLAADRYFGVDQFFGTEVDFGFSKTKEETFQKWTHDRVLYDAVRAVRLYRPLVLASVFVGGVTDGHGHHQVSGEITQEVFTAAADPTVFPEMIAQGLLPWAPLKVYARVPFSRVTAEGMFDYATGKYTPPHFHNYVTGKDITHEPAATVQIHEGEKSTALGMDGDTYVQFARKGLALQKTQIGANVRLAPPGAFDVGYTLMADRTACITTKAGCPTLTTASSSLGWASPKATATNPEQSLFEAIDTTLPGIASLAPAAPATLRQTLLAIDQHIAEAQRLFSPAHLEPTVRPLRDALRTLDTLIADTEKSTLNPTQRFNLLHELRIKRVQLNNALILAKGVTLTAASESTPPRPDGSLLPGASTQVQIKIDRLGPAHLQHLTIDGPAGTIKQLTPGRQTEAAQRKPFTEDIDLPADTPVTRPYFSRPTIEQPFYTLATPDLRNAPATPSPLTVTAHIDDDGVPLEFKSTLVSDGTNTIVSIVPKLSVMISPSLGIDAASRIHTSPISLAATVTSLSPAGGTLRLECPPGWRTEPARATIEPAPLGTHKSFAFSVMPGKVAIDGSYRLTAVAESGSERYTESFRPVGYPGLTYTNDYSPATYRATAIDVHTAPNLHIAYLPGTGDSVAYLLSNLGVTPTLLNPKDLTADTLKPYDAVILGVRAYAAHPELEGPGSKALLDYARNGGIVIVQYNNSIYGENSAPFPISVPGDSAHNVVDEADPVRILAPNSPLLTWPNKITSADFDHWVEERGHGFASTWSSEYQPLVETQDPSQDPQKGGLLYARTGKGAYVYCALALYRQLPEGVPGAYRLFANMLSLARNPNLHHP